MGSLALEPFNNLFVRSSELVLPAEARTVDVIPVDVTVRNKALTIFSNDPRSCLADEDNGYRYRLTIAPEWTSSKEVEGCIGVSGPLGTTKHEISREFSAPPSAGRYSITIELESVDDNGRVRESDSITRIIAVEEASTGSNPDVVEPDDDSTDDSTSGIQFPWPSGGGDGGDGGSGPFGALTSRVDALIALLILFAVGYVLAQFVGGARIAQDVTGAGDGG